MSDEPKVVPMRIGRSVPADKAVPGFRWVLMSPKPKSEQEPSKVLDFQRSDGNGERD